MLVGHVGELVPAQLHLGPGSSIWPAIPLGRFSVRPNCHGELTTVKKYHHLRTQARELEKRTIWRLARSKFREHVLMVRSALSNTSNSILRVKKIGYLHFNVLTDIKDCRDRYQGVRQKSEDIPNIEVRMRFMGGSGWRGVLVGFFPCP